MKLIRLFFFLSLALLAATACSKAGQTKPVVADTPVPAPAQEPAPAPTITETTDRLKAYTFEQRAECKVFVKTLVEQGDAAVAEVSLGYNSMLATPARRAAMVALAEAAHNFKDEAGHLDNVSAETWDSVRSGLVTFWQNLAGALAKARESKA